MTIGWEKIWRENEALAKQWQELPPIDEVVEMAARLEAAGRRRVLDIGCGMGRHLLYLAARGFAVTGTDHAPTAIEKCRQLLAEAGLSADLQQEEMTELSFAPGSFDGVVATQVIHHCRRPALQKIIADIFTLLAGGGWFVWVTPTPDHCEWGRGEEVEPGTWVNPENKEGPIPHHFSTKEEVEELLGAFSIEILEKNIFERENRRYSHWRVLAGKPAGVEYDMPPPGHTAPKRLA